MKRLDHQRRSEVVELVTWTLIFGGLLVTGLALVALLGGHGT